MNLTKHTRIDGNVRTWCFKCEHPVDWWVRSFEVMPHGPYAGTEMPTLTVSCHGDTTTIGCSPEPDVIADFMTTWEKYLSGERVLEFAVPNAEALG